MRLAAPHPLPDAWTAIPALLLPSPVPAQFSTVPRWKHSPPFPDASSPFDVKVQPPGSLLGPRTRRPLPLRLAMSTRTSPCPAGLAAHCQSRTDSPPGAQALAVLIVVSGHMLSGTRQVLREGLLSLGESYWLVYIPVLLEGNCRRRPSGGLGEESVPPVPPIRIQIAGDSGDNGWPLKGKGTLREQTGTHSAGQSVKE